jgi:hypothetical protein
MQESIVLFAAALSLVAQADEIVEDDGARGFGLGVVIGEPTGLTLSLRPTEARAVQSHVSWSFLTGRFRVSLDYLQSVVVVDAPARLDLPLYVGLGATMGAEGGPPWDEAGDPWLGARVPVGISALPEVAPLEVFAEVAPVVYVFPEASAGLEGVLGARVFF